MKKRVVLISVLCIIVIACLVVVDRCNYNTEWIVGQHEWQIRFRYGDFDTEERLSPYHSRCVPAYDGNWEYSKGYYLMNDGYLDMYYAVYFDSDGVALFVDECWSQPGG